MIDRDSKHDMEAEGPSRREKEALAAWTVPDPPAGFPDRVLAMQRSTSAAEPESVAVTIGSTSTRPAGRHRIVPWAVVAVAAVAALFLGQLRSSPATGDASGGAAPKVRESIRLGRRAVAVVEAGAVLSWNIEGGWGRVVQRTGDIFYRAERGGSFEVETARGSVRATGACFRVELNPMKAPLQGAAGAEIGAALIVTVYEGRALFAGLDGEQRQLSAGQVLSSGDGGWQVSDGRSRCTQGDGRP